MTPLAHRIVKELTLPLKERTFQDQCGLMRRMDDVHCFDVTEVFGMASALAEELHSKAMKVGALHMLDEQTFLPAPKTWIELQYANGVREGVLLEERVIEGRKIAVSSWAILAVEGQKYQFASGPKMGALEIDTISLPNDQPRLAVRDLPHESDQTVQGWNMFMLALLAIINSPRLIGRKQHMPHRGLERKLMRSQKLVGKFPLHAWTELKLSVSDIGKRDDGTEYEAHYTGEKCLHFCRSHLRIRNGRLERVKAHWRGNPALGIKQTRYRLTA